MTTAGSACAALALQLAGAVVDEEKRSLDGANSARCPHVVRFRERV